ncbi:hypothetical protein WJX73_008385 [Symbiochloris irregularis]|uniref:MYND-type domain-containing protein n=1 Tax=Symbiochloris irregularis TaxID=706552 RepID=A0AAW1PTH3_9CHLO
MPRKKRSKEVGRRPPDWPVSEDDLVRLLFDWRVDVRDTIQLSFTALKCLFERTIAKVQGLSSHTCNLALSDLPRLDAEPREGARNFNAACSLGELLARPLPIAEYDTSLQHRAMLGWLLRSWEEDAHPGLHYHTEDCTMGVLVMIKSLRLSHKAELLLEVQFMCLDGGCSKEWMEAANVAMKSGKAPCRHVLPLSVLLLREPASSSCSRCQGVKYCSRTCQTAHWPQHKARCKELRTLLQKPLESRAVMGRLGWGFRDVGDGPSLDVPIRPGFLDMASMLCPDGEWGLSDALQPFLASLPEEQPPLQRWYLPDVYGGERFRSKVAVICSTKQLQERQLAIQICDPRGCFEIWILRNQPAYRPLMNLLAQLPFKTYDQQEWESTSWMWTKRISESTLRIYLDDRRDTGNVGALRSLLDRAMQRLQLLPPDVRDWNPSKCLRRRSKPDYSVNFSLLPGLAEPELLANDLPIGKRDTYLQYRVLLDSLMDHWAGELDSCSGMYLHAEGHNHCVLVIIQGIRYSDVDVPWLEVQYIARSNDEAEFDVAAEAQRRPDKIYEAVEQPLVVHLLKEILEANAARLSPAYKQRCRRQWGIGNEPYQVSGIGPAAVLTPEQSESLQARCANEECQEPASAFCSRCESTRYCSRTCQVEHWPQH